LSCIDARQPLHVEFGQHWEVDGQTRACGKRQALAEQFIPGWRRSMPDGRESAHRLGKAPPAQGHICENAGRPARSRLTARCRGLVGKESEVARPPTSPQESRRAGRKIHEGNAGESGANVKITCTTSRTDVPHPALLALQGTCSPSRARLPEFTVEDVSSWDRKATDQREGDTTRGERRDSCGVHDAMER
jgi:hypothetical protein